jgi:hypothetical protein
MHRTANLVLGCTLALMSAGVSSAASISLDTLGADPTLTKPFFTFMTDSFGNYSATYSNQSDPPFDFVTLELVAPFSRAFYFGPSGPKTVGTSCNGGRAFRDCSITFLDTTTTLVFDFFGVDATHGGFRFQTNLGLGATLFEPNQSVGAQATVAPVASPEPGAFQLAGIGFALCGLFMTGKKFLKFGVRS